MPQGRGRIVSYPLVHVESYLWLVFGARPSRSLALGGTILASLDCAVAAKVMRSSARRHWECFQSGQSMRVIPEGDPVASIARAMAEASEGLRGSWLWRDRSSAECRIVSDREMLALEEQVAREGRRIVHVGVCEGEVAWVGYAPGADGTMQADGGPEGAPSRFVARIDGTHFTTSPVAHISAPEPDSAVQRTGRSKPSDAVGYPWRPRTVQQREDVRAYA
jgi:hypothetical protein